METYGQTNFEKVIIYSGENIVDICTYETYQKYCSKQLINDKIYQEKKLDKLLNTSKKLPNLYNHYNRKTMNNFKSFSMQFENFETAVLKDTLQQEYIIVFYQTDNLFNTNVAYFNFSINRQNPFKFESNKEIKYKYKKMQRRKKPKNFNKIVTFQDYLKNKIETYFKNNSNEDSCLSVTGVYAAKKKTDLKIFINRDIFDKSDIQQFLKIIKKYDRTLRNNRFAKLKKELQFINIPIDNIYSIVRINRLKNTIYLECKNNIQKKLHLNKNVKFINGNLLNLKLNRIRYKGSIHNSIYNFVSVIEDLVVNNFKNEDIEKKLKKHLSSCKAFIACLDALEAKHLQRRASNLLCQSLPGICRYNSQQNTSFTKLDLKTGDYKENNIIEDSKVQNILSKIEDLQIKIRALVKSSPSLHKDQQIQSYLTKLDHVQTRRVELSKTLTDVDASPPKKLSKKSRVKTRKSVSAKLEKITKTSEPRNNSEITMNNKMHFEEGRECSSHSSRKTLIRDTFPKLFPSYSDIHEMKKKTINPVESVLLEAQPNLQKLEDFVEQILKINESYFVPEDTTSETDVVTSETSISSTLGLFANQSIDVCTDTSGLGDSKQLFSVTTNTETETTKFSSKMTSCDLKASQVDAASQTETETKSCMNQTLSNPGVDQSTQITKSINEISIMNSKMVASQTDISINKNASIRFSGTTMRLSKNVNITNVRKNFINVRNICDETIQASKNLFKNLENTNTLKEKVQSIFEERNKLENDDFNMNVNYKRDKRVKSELIMVTNCASFNKKEVHPRPATATVKKEELLNQIKSTLENVTERFRKNTLLIRKAANFKDIPIGINMQRISNANPDVLKGLSVRKVQWQIEPQISPSLTNNVIKTKEEITSNLKSSLKLLKNLNDVTKTLRKNPKEASRKLTYIQDELIAQRNRQLEEKASKISSTISMRNNLLEPLDDKNLMAMYASRSEMLNDYGYPASATKVPPDLDNILTPKTRSICNTDLSVIKHRERYTEHVDNHRELKKSKFMPSVKSRHIIKIQTKKKRQMYIAKAYKKAYTQSPTAPPIIQTTIENPLVPKIVRPVRRKVSLPDTPKLSNLSLKDVQPFHSEYPRKDNFNSGNETYLDRLLNSGQNSVNSLFLPLLRCSDQDCTSCKNELMVSPDKDEIILKGNLFSSNNKAREHFRIDKSRLIKPDQFNFDRFMSDPQRTDLKPENINYTVCPVNVSKSTQSKTAQTDSTPRNTKKSKSIRKTTPVTQNSDNSTGRAYTPLNKKLNEVKTNQNKIQKSIQQAIIKNQEKFQAMQRIITLSKPPERRLQQISKPLQTKPSKVTPKITSSHTKKIEKIPPNLAGTSRRDIQQRIRTTTQFPGNCSVFDKKYSERVSLSSIKSKETLDSKQICLKDIVNSNTSQADIQKYISLVEQKFLKTFSLNESEKETAYKNLVSEIQEMLNVLNNREKSFDKQDEIHKSVEKLSQESSNSERMKTLKEKRSKLKKQSDKLASVSEQTHPDSLNCVDATPMKPVYSTDTANLISSEYTKITDLKINKKPLKKYKANLLEVKKSEHESNNEIITIYKETGNEIDDSVKKKNNDNSGPTIIYDSINFHDSLTALEAKQNQFVRHTTISNQTFTSSSLLSHNDYINNDNNTNNKTTDDVDDSTFDSLSEDSSSNEIMLYICSDVSVTIYYCLKLCYSYVTESAEIAVIPTVWQQVHQSYNYAERPLTESFIKKYQININSPESYSQNYELQFQSSLSLKSYSITKLFTSDSNDSIEQDFFREYSDKLLSESLNTYLNSNSEINLLNIDNNQAIIADKSTSNPNFLEYLEILTSVSRVSVELEISTKIYYKFNVNYSIISYIPEIYYNNQILTDIEYFFTEDIDDNSYETIEIDDDDEDDYTDLETIDEEMIGDIGEDKKQMIEYEEIYLNETLTDTDKNDDVETDYDDNAYVNDEIDNSDEATIEDDTNDDIRSDIITEESISQNETRQKHTYHLEDNNKSAGDHKTIEIYKPEHTFSSLSQELSKTSFQLKEILEKNVKKNCPKLVSTNPTITKFLSCLQLNTCNYRLSQNEYYFTNYYNNLDILPFLSNNNNRLSSFSNVFVMNIHMENGRKARKISRKVPFKKARRNIIVLKSCGRIQSNLKLNHFDVNHEKIDRFQELHKNFLIFFYITIFSLIFICMTLNYKCE